MWGEGAGGAVKNSLTVLIASKRFYEKSTQAVEKEHRQHPEASPDAETTELKSSHPAERTLTE